MKWSNFTDNSIRI